MKTLGKQCNTYQSNLMCSCGGHFIGDVFKGKDIDGEFVVPHTCDKCHKLIYVADIYPKHLFDTFGEDIYFGNVSVYESEE